MRSWQDVNEDYYLRLANYFVSFLGQINVAERARQRIERPG